MMKNTRKVKNADDKQNHVICYVVQSLFAELKFKAYFFLTSSVNMLKKALTVLSSFQESFNCNFFWPSKVPCIFTFVFGYIARFTSTKYFLKIFYPN